MTINTYSEITPEVLRLSEKCVKNGAINPSLYSKYDVKRGLRDINGKGVLVGLTEIGDVMSYIYKDGQQIPVDGKLFYRGIDVEEIVAGFLNEDRLGFEEVTYLLLFGVLPDKDELANFNKLLAEYRTLPTSFTRDVIMKSPSRDMMNSLARSVLMLYSYDDKADDVSVPNVLRQSLQLIAQFPLLSVYSYQAYRHYHLDKSLYIISPKEEYSTSENILRMLRRNHKFTPLEAKVLDLALVLHAEHGGGNNSTFTNHVVTSSGTDTYSTVSASLGSLKGPKHGGANIKVIQMFDDIKANITDWEDDEQIKEYLRKILNKEVFDKAGLIYGIGHAVYSISDPRARVFRGFVESLAKEKGMDKEFNLYSKVEEIAPIVIGQERHIYKGVSANIDFYSGFVYRMLGLPEELYTPLFAIARISGWSAHRIEEILNKNRIYRPAFKNVCERTQYIPLSER